MNYIIIIAIGYLIGSISASYFIGKLNGINVKKSGSGNLGASNTLVLMGWKAGIFVALHDIIKAIVAIVIVRMIFSDVAYASEVAGVACVVGHIFPFYLGFNGGKGFASYVGMALALDWKLAIGVILLAAILTLLSDYIVTATLATIVLVPLYIAFIHHNYISALILSIASIIMVFKHLENIKRIMNGTEIGLRSAHKGEHRMK
jgi:glycerol-3-phosphate acyltransferase PlsY